MTRSVVETVEGLREIVESWLRDPCFNLVEVACSEGYREHEKELKIYELKWQIRWDNDWLKSLIAHKESYDPVARAFEMEKTRKAIAENTNKIFELTGLSTMEYIK